MYIFKYNTMGAEEGDYSYTANMFICTLIYNNYTLVNKTRSKLYVYTLNILYYYIIYCS